MEKQKNIIIKIVAFILMSFATGLIVVGNSFLSTGFSYHLSSELGKVINIICILAGSLLILGEAIIIFCIYLPRQRKKRSLRYQSMIESYRQSRERQPPNQ